MKDIFLSKLYPIMRLLAFTFLMGCASNYRSIHYKREAWKAQTVCPNDYQYTQPVSPKKSFNTFTWIVIPLSIPFLIVKFNSQE